MSIAFIGWGRMGRPMGCRLLAAGHRLHVHDTAERALRFAKEDGADAVTSAATAVAEADIVITMLPDAAAVTTAAHTPGGILDGLRAGSLWLEMSSSHPETTRTLSQAAADRSATLLDAPVSGGVVGAQEGTLTIMVGGPADVLPRAEPVLSVLGENIVHAGGRQGDGDLTKTINNMLSAINLTAAAEGLALGLRGGLDPEILLKTIASSTGASHALQMKIPRYVLSGRFDAGFSIRQLLKDLRIAQSVAAGWEVPTTLGSVIQSQWTALAAQGHGDEDHTMVVKLLAARAGVDIPTAPPTT